MNLAKSFSHVQGQVRPFGADGTASADDNVMSNVATSLAALTLAQLSANPRQSQQKGRCTGHAAWYGAMDKLDLSPLRSNHQSTACVNIRHSSTTTNAAHVRKALAEHAHAGSPSQQTIPASCRNPASRHSRCSAQARASGLAGMVTEAESGLLGNFAR